MIKTMMAGGADEPPRRTYTLGSAACGGCGTRSGCSCDTKVDPNQQSMFDKPPVSMQAKPW